MSEDLNTATQELEKRMRRLQQMKDARANPPQPLVEIDWAPVLNTVQLGMAAALKDGFMDEDLRAYVYETVMEAVYGKDFWKWKRLAFN